MAGNPPSKGAPGKRQASRANEAARKRVKVEEEDVEVLPASSRLGPATANAAPELPAQSLMVQAQKSTYGTFTKALEGIDLAKFEMKLPRIIVIGNESVGKSSLLENITKCSIFPADHSQCTRIPMLLKLVHVSNPADKCITVEHGSQKRNLKDRGEVLACVTAIMKAIPARSFQSTEITVTICETDVPDFEFVDLPGVVQLPQEAREESNKIISKYLKEPTTMVICVLAAPSQLNESGALALVEAHNRYKDTIIAMTKCDQVTPSSVQHKIVERVLRSSDELQDGGMPQIAGLVGVINRETGTRVNLDQAAAKEKEKFQSLVLDRISGEQQALRAQIERNITIPVLIDKIDQQFSTFITKTWKPLALTWLAPHMAKLEADVKCLGYPVSQLTPQKVLAEVVKQMDLSLMAEAVSNTDIPITLNATAPSQTIPLGNASGIDLSEHFGLWGTVKWAQRTRTVRDSVRQTAFGMFHGDARHAFFLPSLQKPVREVFDKAPTNPASPGMKLARLTDLKTQILQHILPAMYEKALISIREGDQILKDVDRHMATWSGRTVTSMDLQQLDRIIKGCFLQEFVRLLQHDLPRFKFPSGFKIEEDATHSIQRADLQSRLNKLQRAKQTIEGLS